MYSTIAALVLLAGVVTIEGCKPQDIASCQTIAPSGNSAKEICKASKGLVACMMKAIEGCGADIEKQFEAQIAAANPEYCNEESTCNAVKMQECTKGMPTGGQNGQDMDISVICPKLQPMLSCLTNLASNCDNEQMKASIMQQVQAMEQMKKPCEQMGGQSGGDGTYETGTEANNGGDKMENKDEMKGGDVKDDDTDAAAGLQGAFSLLVCVLLVQLFARM